MFKAIIIGCGKIAGIFDETSEGLKCSHASAYRHTHRVLVVDYIDIVAEKAEKLARRYGGKSFGTDFMTSIARRQPDIVSVCTPDDTHFAIVHGILKGGILPKIIFVEKPACLSPGELDCLNSLAQERGVLIVVNHSRRFDGRYRRIKEAITTGRFGRLVRCDVCYYGGWKHNGVHVVDTLLFLFDDKLAVQRILGTIPTHQPDDPTIEMHLYFKKSGADVYLHAFDEMYYQVFDFDLKFERARLRIEDFENRFILEQKTVNSTNENVLIADEIDVGVKGSPMMTAIGLMVDYLKTGDGSLLNEYGIERAGMTMDVLWEGEKAYETEFAK